MFILSLNHRCQRQKRQQFFLNASFFAPNYAKRNTKNYGGQRARAERLIKVTNQIW
jgi:hypothetical protein